MVSTLKVFLGAPAVTTVWGGEGKSNGQWFDAAYPEWTKNKENFLRISSNIAHTDSKSFSIYHGITWASDHSYIYNIPENQQGGVQELSHYSWWDGYNGTDFVLGIQLWNTVTASRVWMSIWHRNYFGDNYKIWSQYRDKGVYNEDILWLLGTTDYTASKWTGIKMKWDSEAKTVYLYRDLTDSGIWQLMGTWTFEDVEAIDQVRIVGNSQNYSWTSSDHLFLDDVTWTTGGYDYSTPDILPTKVEFYKEESSIGGGYMIVPDKNVTFDDYNDYQEQHIHMLDDQNVPIYYGLITNPIKLKDGVKLEFKDVSHELRDRYCKRIYGSESGIITRVGIG